MKFSVKPFRILSVPSLWLRREIRSQESGVRSTPRASAREDLRRNWRSVASQGKNALYGGASEAKAEITLVRGVRSL